MSSRTYSDADEEIIKRVFALPNLGYAEKCERAIAEGVVGHSANAIYQHWRIMDIGANRQIVAATKPTRALPVVEIERYIIAHRIWEVRPAGRIALLESCATRAIWPAGEPMVAHEIGERKDHTGIHAFKKQRTPQEYVKDYSVDGFKIPLLARGTVYLWGQIIEHEHGYRAEFAYPDVVVVQSEQLAQAVRRTYGCETIFGEWDKSKLRNTLA